MIKIIQPNESDNGYKFEFELYGKKGTGYLTYDLMGDLNLRTLLLTHNTNFIEDTNVENNFEALKDLINLQRNSKGAVHIAKNITNRIYDSNIGIQNTSIAVHKFGAVPVCVIPKEFEIEFNGVKRLCKIGVYPYIESKTSINNYLGVSKIEFLKSLKIHLDVIFKRYLEDIGEHFFDIENHSDLPWAIKKAKSCERTISESINSKLKSIDGTIRGQGNSFHELSKLRSQLRSRYASCIFSVEYAKYYALFFLNELYKSIGFGFKDYEKEFQELKKKIYRFEDKINSDNDLLLLRQSIRNYFAGEGHLNLDHQLSSQTSSLWVKRFIDFSIFVYYQNKEKTFTLQTSHIFLSNRFSQSDSIAVKSHLKSIIQKYFSNKIELISVNEKSAGKYINEIVKSKIWQSDAAYGIVPIKKNDFEDNFEWVAKEMIHSEVLKKQIIFILNKEQNKKQIDDFKNYLIKFNHYLVSDTRCVSAYKKSLIKKLENKSNATYDLKEMDINPFKDSLFEDMNMLIQKKIIKIIKAWLNQFDDEIATAIIQINIKLQRPCKVSEASRICFGLSVNNESKKKFQKVWRHAKSRKLSINGKDYTLIKSMGIKSGMYYEQNFSKIIKELLGNKTDFKQILESCFNLKGF